MIGLPSGLFYGTSIPAILLIINKKKPVERKDKVIFINGELEYEEIKNQNRLTESNIQHILNVYETFKDEKRYSKVVSMDEIQKNDFNLNIRRYADTTPPPEQFDVKEVLSGGIPVSEVEDDYIQETLDGMDVSCVFVRKDNEYYIFKTEIKNKEQIRDYIGTKDQSIINQFERWWDKYQVSLNEIDKELKKSEEIMWNYLKELGYE